MHNPHTPPSPTHTHITHLIYTHPHSPHTHPPLSMHTPHQGRGNNVTLTRSTFHQNTAHNIGSAVMFASLLYVQNRAESHHYLTEDWSVTCPNNQSDSSLAFLILCIPILQWCRCGTAFSTSPSLTSLPHFLTVSLLHILTALLPHSLTVPLPTTHLLGVLLVLGLSTSL